MIVDSPNKINLMTSEEVRSQGWQAESRDRDGHLLSIHAPFDTHADIVWFVREALEMGGTVTIWPIEGQHFNESYEGAS